MLLERENVVRKVVWYPRACAVFGASGASTRALFKPYYNTGDNMTAHKAPLLACVRYLAYCSMGREGGGKLLRPGHAASHRSNELFT